MGQRRSFADVRVTSVKPPTTDSHMDVAQVGSGPNGDIMPLHSITSSGDSSRSSALQRVSWSRAAASLSWRIPPTAEVADNYSILLSRGRTAHSGSLSAGSRMLNTDPLPTPDEAQSLPSWASMIDRQTDSPIPIPWNFVEKNASKMWSMFFGSMPSPESSTDTHTPSGL